MAIKNKKSNKKAEKIKKFGVEGWILGWIEKL
jgi:hypothetical protein